MGKYNPGKWACEITHSRLTEPLLSNKTSQELKTSEYEKILNAIECIKENKPTSKQLRQLLFDMTSDSFLINKATDQASANNIEIDTNSETYNLLLLQQLKQQVGKKASLKLKDLEEVSSIILDNSLSNPLKIYKMKEIQINNSKIQL